MNVDKLLYSLAGKYNFDLYGRYAMITRIIEANRTKQGLKILDVGGYNGQLAEFLPYDHITILDIFDDNAPNYVKGDALNMTFADSEFDVVVSADVFEHIPENKRDRFMEESYRVSQDFLILAAPFDQPGVSAAEVRANDLYKSFTGHDYIWLSEHIANGLPRPKSTEAWINRKDLKYYKLQNNRLDEWENLIKSFFTLDTHPSVQGEALFRRLNTKYNLGRNQAAITSDSYRSIYVIGRNILAAPKFEDSSNDLDFTDPAIPQSIIDAYQQGYATPIVPATEFWLAKHGLGFTTRQSPYEVNLLWEIERLQAEKTQLDAIRASRSFRLMSKLNSIASNVPGVSTAKKTITVARNKKAYLYPSNLSWRLKTGLSASLKSSYESIYLPSQAKPLVSIVIPVMDQAHFTIRCLYILSKHQAESSFEVIVIDNASHDATNHILTQLPGLAYIRNNKNRGFGDACNQGVEAAKGEIIVFLNNDTEVQPGWLDALVAGLELPNAGLVGSMLIYPSGILQEAGGVIFGDGNGWNYGRGDSPAGYKYSYVREVDYCSAASAAVRRDVFLKLGGFDPLYAPAYYEDTDLAFGIRKLGLKVYYQPLSRVIHYEGGTSGTDLKQGLKKNQVINRTKFVEKWVAQLRRQWVNEADLMMARDRSTAKKVLIIEHQVPDPTNDSGAVRLSAMLKILRELGFGATLWPHDLKNPEPQTTRLQQQGVEVVYGLNRFEDFALSRPDYFDVIILSRADLASDYLERCRQFFPKAKLIYDTVDLSYLRVERQAKLENSPALKVASGLWKKLELTVANEADVTLVVSDIEKEALLTEIGSANVQTLSNIHELKTAGKPFKQRKNLLFIGNYNHTPNEDAIIWFAKEILPLVLKHKPDIKLTVLGSNPTTAIKALASSSIDVVGYVESVGEYFESHRVFVTPLRYGAGVKGKIGQSIEYGLPVVSTSIGAEGMHLINNESVLISDDAALFAKDIIKAYTDEALWLKLQRNSRQTLKKYFSSDTAKRAIESIMYDEL